MLNDFTLTEAVEFAVATEEMGERAYTKLAERFATEEEIADVFSRLATDERMHKAQFQALLDQVPPDDDIMTKDEKSRYLRAMAMSEFFRGDTKLIGKLDRTKNLDEALGCVMGFEKATLGYYLAIKDVLGDSDALDRIIEAEKSHIARLMKYILTDEKMKGLADVF